MEQLLQPGLPRHLRRIRSHVFRVFLIALTSEFRELSLQLRLLQTASYRDRPDLGFFLIQQQVLFYGRALRLYFYLDLYCWTGCPADVRAHLAVLELCQVQLMVGADA